MIVNKVAICGGTHGNELNGVFLLKHWQHSDALNFPTLDIELVLANPGAHIANRRYLDQDLNRQFSLDDLANPLLSGYEQLRAKTLNQQLGPKGNPATDFIIDLHSTTANMGTTLIFNNAHPLTMGMAFYVKDRMPEATIFFEDLEPEEDNFLVSVGKFPGFLIEIGPVPQGVLRAETYEASRKSTLYALEYLDKINQGELPALSEQHEAFEFLEKVDLPLNEQGDIAGMIHPQRQDQDYQAIHPGDPLFMLLDGSTVTYTGKQVVYGAFINEAAYYDRKVGLSLMSKTTLKAPDLETFLKQS